MADKVTPFPKQRAHTEPPLRLEDFRVPPPKPWEEDWRISQSTKVWLTVAVAIFFAILTLGNSISASCQRDPAPCWALIQGLNFWRADPTRPQRLKGAPPGALQFIWIRKEVLKGARENVISTSVRARSSIGRAQLWHS